MAEFEVKVVRVANVTNTPNSDRLTNVQIADYICVSAKLEDGTPRYKAGDAVVYIPEGAVVPEWILRNGFWNAKTNTGLLAGPEGNRVKAAKIRGQLSRGILYPVGVRFGGAGLVLKVNGGKYEGLHEVKIGDNVAELLGITKYEPVVPEHMAGQVCNLGGKVLKFDIENLKKYPDILQPGEPVVVQEKIHGSFTGLGYWPGLGHPELLRGDFFAFSKGNGGKGLVFKNTPENENNVYHRVLVNSRTQSNHYFYEIMFGISQRYGGKPVYVLGETYGAGIQDLDYGQARPTFAVFDIWVGTPGEGRYLDDEEYCTETYFWHMNTCTELYRGAFDRGLMDDLKEGRSATAGEKHVREGIVIRPTVGRRHDAIGRVILKHVGDGYLTRGGPTTEYN
jgi:RNA ligase (TIGR02306 family)